MLDGDWKTADVLRTFNSFGYSTRKLYLIEDRGQTDRGRTEAITLRPVLTRWVIIGRTFSNPLNFEFDWIRHYSMLQFARLMFIS